MEYFAKITSEQRSKDGRFWKYAFIDIQTGEKDCFYHSHKIDYIPNLAGKLNISSDNPQFRLYRDYKQDIVKVANSFQHLETSNQLEKEWKEGIKEVDIDFNKRKKIRLNPQQIAKLRQTHSWKWIADFCQANERTVRRWNNPIKRPKHKKGRKLKIDDHKLMLLLSFFSRNNTKTQQEAADYLFRQTGELFGQSAISRALKREGITHKKAAKRYSEQNLEKVRHFLIDNYPLYSSPYCLAVDECGFNLGEAARYAYSRKGCRAVISRPGQRGSNYTLILCIQNIEKQAVISYKLIKGGAKAKDFHDFLKDIKLPKNKEHYLLLDNAKVHHATKTCRDLGLASIEELAKQKGVKLKYLPSYSPQINPAELCFNTIRHNIEKSQSWEFGKLELVIDREISILQQKNLTKYFHHCRDYFSLTKTGI